jgi:hypothetical protein
MGAILEFLVFMTGIVVASSVLMCIYFLFVKDFMRMTGSLSEYLKKKSMDE